MRSLKDFRSAASFWRSNAAALAAVMALRFGFFASSSSADGTEEGFAASSLPGESGVAEAFEESATFDIFDEAAILPARESVGFNVGNDFLAKLTFGIWDASDISDGESFEIEATL